MIVPMLKKPGLNTADRANFRPVYNLTFMSKVIERAVARQLHEHLTAEDLLPRCQSAYRKQHSTETAMLRVLSDATADDRQVTLIALLDLSSAFDFVDHKLLLRRLQYNFGFIDDVLRWMTSFVSGRTQQVSLRSAVVHSSSTVRSSTGVRPRPPPLRPVHCRLEQGHSQSWSAAAPVRGRLSSLCDEIGRWL